MSEDRSAKKSYFYWELIVYLVFDSCNKTAFVPTLNSGYLGARKFEYFINYINMLSVKKMEGNFNTNMFSTFVIAQLVSISIGWRYSALTFLPCHL